MPLQYRDVYDRWQRSKSFGDPRDLPTFSTDLNESTGTDDFSAGIDPSWWKRTSTAADVNVFEPIAKYSGLEAAGRGIGGLFGGQGAETGARIARGLPRTVAQTLPLVAAEFATGGLATPAIVGGALATGGLFGAQTYAETGDPTAAAISGVTAAALPAVGRAGGALGVKFLGPEVERVATREGFATLPKEAGRTFQFKAARLAGSQVGMVGALQGSAALQAREMGTPYEPLSPEFWAQQIPFSLLDIAQTARAKVPTAAQAKIAPILPKGKDYIPPKVDPASEANLGDMLDRMTGVAKDQTITPEEKSKMFNELLGTVMNPEQTKPVGPDKVILIGHPAMMDNGSVKLYATKSKFYDLPDHSNVFINNPDSATQLINPDGSVTFITERKNVSSNVKYPKGPNDFPATRGKGQATLLEKAPVVEGGGIAPEADLLSLRQKFQQTVGNEMMFQTALGKEPKDPDQAVAYWQQAIDKMTPAHLKPGYVSPFDTDEQQVMTEAGVDPTVIATAPEPTITERTVPALAGNEPGGIADRSSKASSDELIRMVREGEKPATMLGNSGNDITRFGESYSLEEAQGWVNRAKEQGLVTKVHSFTDKEGGVSYIALAGDGQDSVNRLDQAITRDPDRSYADKQTQIGKALGYSDEDIGKHVDYLLQHGGDKIQTVKSITQKIQTSTKAVDDAQEKLNLVPKTTDDVAPMFEERLVRPAVKTVDGKVFVGHIHVDAWERAGSPEEGNYDDGWVTDKGRFLTKAEAAQQFPTSFDRAAADEIGSSDSLLGSEELEPLTPEEEAGKVSWTPDQAGIRTPQQRADELIKEGLAATEALEKLRLQQKTPIIDKGKQQVKLSQGELQDLHDQLLKLGEAARGVEEPLVDPKTGKPITGETEEERAILRAEANKRLKAAGLPTGGVAAIEGAFPEKPAAKYGKPVRDEKGKNFKTRALAEATRDADPDLEGYTVRDAGKKKGFYLAKQVNLEASLEGAPGTSLENVLGAEPKVETTVPIDVETIRDQLIEEAATTAENVPPTEEIFTPDAEDRPPDSFKNYLGQLDLASKNPTRLQNAAGFPDLPTSITAIRQFRTAITDVFSKGKEGFKDVNEALQKAGISQFESEKKMQNTFRMMRSGMEEFSGKFLSFALDSQTPHDAQLVQEIGILHPERGATNFLDWFIKNTPLGDLRDLVVGLRNTSDFAHIKLTNDEGKGTWYQPKTKELNLGHLPADREDALNVWGPQVLEEISHDTLSDLETRVDPAAMEFKATLQRILKVTRDSKLLPKEVRDAVKLAVGENWYGKGARDYNDRYDKALPGREHWKGVHYSLLNEYELIGGIFNSPELRRILRDTTMPKSPVPILNFFANAWARMFGYTPNAGNAFAKILGSYDNYLSGTRNAKGYNGMSYIRDSLVASGVKSEGLASRLNTIADLYNTGDIASSIKGYEREAENGLLPATTVAGPLNEDLKTSIVSGDAKTVGDSTDNLLAETLPQHKALLQRMQEDLRIAKNLYNEAQKGNLYAELSLFQEGLKSHGAKLNAMKTALEKQDKALGRLQSIDALGNNEGIERLWSSTLKGTKVAEPTDQSGNEDVARQALGLENPSAEYVSARRREVAATGEKPMGLIDRLFKFASFTSEEQPGFKPIYTATHITQSDAYRRMTELTMVKNSGPTKGWDKAIAKANQRVGTTPGLNRIASDIMRRAQVMDRMKMPFSFDDPEVSEALRRASTEKRRSTKTSDRDDVITAVNSEFARAQHYINSVVPEHLTRMNRILTSGAIIGREIGMPYTKAWDLAGQMYTALAKLRDPAQAPAGAEELRAIASQMQPDTFSKVAQQSQGFINDSERHLAVLKKYPNYVSEQRYGNFHLVMSREGEPLRESYNTEKAARSRSKELQTDGWVLEDIIPKNRTNVANIWGHDPVVSSMQELDQQALNRFESLIADLPAEKREQLRPLVERAADYMSSSAAFTPIPTQAGPRRRFVPGRETIDMIDNAEQYYRRSANWMRHRETRSQTAFQMLDPEILGNRPLREYSQQFVDNQLAPDNPVARRLAEATFYWNLAGNLGVDFLHSIQTLTTGMASVISETGGIGDALKYVSGASGKVFKRYTTGKWADKNTEYFVNRLTAEGGMGLPAWGDIFDPTTMNYFQTQGPESTYGKALNAVKAGVRGYKGIFLRHNDMVGGLAGFQLGLDRGMNLEDAFHFGVGVKDRGFYSAGKVQRPVGAWSIKEKAVPQMLFSLRTYILGWFSQLSHNYKVGFAGAPEQYSPAQVRGAKQAFAYMLGAQAVLAGALGLPGVGQGLGLLKQTTGLDLKGWTRKNLAAMFGEDQDDYGGLMTGMALHGLVAQFAPFDPSGRHIPNFPFVGVSASKGFDITSMIPAPFTTAADMISGLSSAAKGGDPSKALPSVLRGPVNLLQGGGDIRNSRGELLYQLSPSERVVKALGLEPSRVAAAKETAATVNEMNKAAAAHKDSLVDQVATLYRRGDTINAQKQLAQIQKDNPTYDMASFVRTVSAAVEKQTIPFDWKREVNPALDIAGLSSNQPSRELERLQLRRGVSSDLGLYEPPNLRGNIRAASTDELMNTDPYLTLSAARQRLLTARRLRRPNISLEPSEYQ